jgi:acylphosphatase
MNKRLHIFVGGKVQGVCFRNFTQEVAEMLGLTGTAENLNEMTDDEKVEIVAEGKKSVLELFAEIIKFGPRAALVSSMGVEFETPLTGFKSFEVIRPIRETHYKSEGKQWVKPSEIIPLAKKDDGKWKKVGLRVGFCPRCKTLKDFEITDMVDRFICYGCGEWFSGKEIEPPSLFKAKKVYVHQPNQYPKGSLLREDGNDMLHAIAMRQLGYSCPCIMCQRARQIVDDANSENALRNAEVTK